MGALGVGCTGGPRKGGRVQEGMGRSGAGRVGASPILSTPITALHWETLGDTSWTPEPPHQHRAPGWTW